MDDSLLYDEGGLFDGPNYQGEVLKFFQTVGHTSAVAPLIVAEDILHCIYSELNFNAFFDKNERSAFSCIESLSRLFTLDSEAFYKSQISQVHYYAVLLNTSKSERTITANAILNAFAKNTSDYVVIMFRHEKMCMLAFGKKTNGSMTFFSDWFDERNVIDIVSKVDIRNLSLNSSHEFFFDFVYMAARSYYTQPMSRDYAYSEWCSMNILSDGEEDYTRSRRSEYVNNLMYAHIHEYGDDYIEIQGIDDYQTGIISDNDYDFDLLELELDEMMAAEVFEMDDDEYGIEEDDFFDETEHIDAENIPPEILSDPVKLLEWLRKNERLNEDEQTQNDDIYRVAHINILRTTP